MAGKDEIGTDSAPDVESKDRLPDRPGKDSPDTVPNNIEGRDSVGTTKREESSIWLPKAWDRSSLHIKTSTLELEKNGDNPSCEAICQPSILQERYAHEAIKVEVESKQVNNSQITKSRILFTNENGFKKDEEGHTQGRDTPQIS